MKKLKLKDLKNSSVYVTPHFPILSTKRYKIGFLSFILIIGGYSLLVALFTIGILVFTPAKEIPFLFENIELQKQQANVEILEQKVRLLTAEINRISDINKSLKYAIILGIEDSIDTTNAVYDSLKTKKESGFENNIFGITAFLINKYFAQNSSTFFISPVNGFIVKEYNEKQGHLGIDYGVKDGTVISAASGGYVIFAGRTFEDGNVIIIKHKGEYISIYKHCSVLLKKNRDTVVQGEAIALSGNSGYNTTGAHLHFEIWKNGKAVNPKNFLINN